MEFGEWLKSNPLWWWLLVSVVVSAVLGALVLFAAVAFAPSERPRRRRASSRTAECAGTHGVTLQEVVLRSDHALCPVCYEPFADEDRTRNDIVTCERCGTLHHRLCLAYVGTCSTYACTGSEHRTYDPSATPEAGAEDPSATPSCRYCPKCGDEYRPGFTRCADCDVPLVGAPPSPPNRPSRPEEGILHLTNSVEKPCTYDVEHRNREMRLACPWASLYLILAVPYTIFITFTTGQMIVDFPGRNGWFSSLVSILLMGGLSLAGIYYTLALLINETEIKGANGALTISHGPLPWWGNQTLPVREIQRLFCERKVIRTRRGRYVYHQVCVMRRDSSTETLIGGLSTAEKALFIEQEIRRYMQMRP